jgi:MFS family permease
MFSMLSVGSFAGALWAARRTTSTVDGVIRGSVAFGVGMAAVALSPSLWVAGPAVVVAGFASMQIMTSATALIQTRAAPDYRGRVLALQAMVFLGSTPIGGPVVGAVCDLFGARAGFAVGAAACFAAALWGRARAGRTAVAV